MAESRHSGRSDEHKTRERHVNMVWCLKENPNTLFELGPRCKLMCDDGGGLLASSQQACSLSCRLMVHMSFNLQEEGKHYNEFPPLLYIDPWITQ